MGAPFTHDIRVPWGDVDLSTTIYYPRVFHYFETAIEEFFRARGIEYGKFSDAHGVMLARVAAHAEYTAPIRFHDLLQVSVDVARLGGKSVTFGCEARCGGKTVARGTTTGIAVQTGQWKSVEIPPNLRKILEDARGGAPDGAPRPLLEPSANCHRWSHRIHAGDVDLARLIYYPTLFHLFEQSIEDLFRVAFSRSEEATDTAGGRAMNAPYRGDPKDPASRKRVLDVSLVFPRVSVRGEFLAPIRVGDLLTFEVGIPRTGNTSVTFASRAVKGDGTVAARAEVTAVTVDKAKWEAVPVPESFKVRAREWARSCLPPEVASKEKIKPFA